MRIISLKAKWVWWAALAAVLALGVFTAARGARGTEAQVIHPPWTAAASTGMVDEVDRAEVEFNGGRARVKATSGTVVLRYNVTGGVGNVLGVRYRDGGSLDRVVAKLIRKDLQSGAETTMLTFDSDQAPQSSSLQYRTVGGCAGIGFEGFAYLVEVELQKFGTLGAFGDPLLEGLDIHLQFC